MGALTIELPVQEDQTAFNLRRWSELLADSELTRFQRRIETEFNHGGYQAAIAFTVGRLLPHGRVITECPISTADGVRAADVAWISQIKLGRIGRNVCLTEAPEICVEVLSPDNSAAEMAEKKALYFAAGAAEVWFCQPDGGMVFFNSASSAGERNSRLCSQFPAQIVLQGHS
ncbi:MAG: Uma2 family endonuclease [Chthoniobacterales bacterium]